VDVGSSTTKFTIISEDYQVVGHSVVYTHARHEKAIAESVEKIKSLYDISLDDIANIVGTGYGRNNIPFANQRMTELFCHGKGARFLYPNARFIIDIGGQDSKVIELDHNGNMTNFVMNEKCAAGTGKFLEAMARTLDKKLTEFESLAAKSGQKVSISNTCTVFAESEVISRISQGKKIEDIISGRHDSIAERICGMVRRLHAVPDIVMIGGVARNRGVVKAIEDIVGCTIVVPDEPQVTGSLGAAVHARQSLEK
jgi:predicted CoA-substrate-specific enzyme activase